MGNIRPFLALLDLILALWAIAMAVGFVGRFFIVGTTDGGESLAAFLSLVPRV